MSRPEALLLVDVPFALRKGLWHTQADHVLLNLRADNNQLRAQRDALLEALLGVEKRCSHSGYVGNDGQFLKVIQAAIAKAEGQ